MFRRIILFSTFFYATLISVLCNHGEEVEHGHRRVFLNIDDPPVRDTDDQCVNRIYNNPNYCYKHKDGGNHFQARMHCPITCLMFMGYTKKIGNATAIDWSRANRWRYPADCTVDASRNGVSWTPFCLMKTKHIPEFCNKKFGCMLCPKTCSEVESTCKCDQSD